MPGLLPANIQAINLLSRINVLGPEVAMALSNLEMTAEEADLLAYKLTLLRQLEIDIKAAEYNGEINRYKNRR